MTNIAKEQGLPTEGGAVVFDVYGTIYNLDKAAQRLNHLFGVSPATVDLWWSLALQDAQALVLNGKYAPFEQVLEESLRRAVLITLLPFSAPNMLHSPEFESHIKDVMKSLSDLDLKRGAREAFEEWKRNGWKLYCLSNGTEEAVQKLLEKDDLTSLFDGILSCHSIQKIKAHPDVYKMMDNITGGPKGKWLVSSHAFDIVGALSNGFNAIFLNDVEHKYPAKIYPSPSLVTKSVREACQFTLGSLS